MTVGIDWVHLILFVVGAAATYFVNRTGGTKPLVPAAQADRPVLDAVLHIIRVLVNPAPAPASQPKLPAPTAGDNVDVETLLRLLLELLQRKVPADAVRRDNVIRDKDRPKNERGGG